MADNTTLNPMTGGDVVRDISRSGIKTQVVQLDVGGEAAESLVSPSNPVPVAQVGAASDILSGDNIWERLIDGSFALPIVETNLKLDPTGAVYEADCKVITCKPATAVTNQWSGAIDTTGYDSFSIGFRGGTASAEIQGSNDGATWVVLPVYSSTVSNFGITASAIAFTVAGAHVYGACNFRYLRTITTAYTSGPVVCVILLRSTAISSTGATNVTLTSNAVTAVGTVAAAGSPGNLLQVGYETVTAAAAALTASKVYPPGLSSASQVLIKPFCSVEQDWMANGVITSSTSAVALSAAGASGIRNYCTGVQLTNSSSTATGIEILDGSTVIWQGWLPASMNQPMVVPFQTPLHGTAATAMNIQATVSVASVYYSAQGYQSA